MLVRQMVEATNGFYFEAAQQMSAQNLADLSITWGRSHRNDGRTFPTWNGFVDHLPPWHHRVPRLSIRRCIGRCSMQLPRVP